MPLRLLALVLFAALVSFGAARPIPVILDTDIGDDIDDALALALALQSPEIDVKAVVTVLQHRERRADLVWKILELYNRTDIPVGMGAEQPLITAPRTSVVAQTWALGASYKMPDSKRRNGIELLIETCLKAPEKVVVLAYGPATNLALALKAEPAIKDKIDRIVLMNGVFFKSPRAEYNTLRDPEASQIVYNSGLPVTTVGLDVTMQCRLGPDEMNRIEASELPTVKFLRELIHIWQNGKPEHRPVLHDPLAIAVTFQPELVTLQTGKVDVELRGQHTYGVTYLRPNPSGLVKVAAEVSSAEFLKLFMDRIMSRPRPAQAAAARN